MLRCQGLVIEGVSKLKLIASASDTAIYFLRLKFLAIAVLILVPVKVKPTMLG